MKFLLIFLVLIVENPVIKVNSLICFECTKYYFGVNCFNPAITGNAGSIDCTHSKFIYNNYPGAKYQCITYIDRNRLNRTEIVRGCALKTDSDFCDLHKTDAQLKGLNVIDCYSCKDDYCNGAKGTEMKFKLLTMLLSILCFLLLRN